MKKQEAIIVIPAYNEAGRIGAVISSIPRTLKVQGQSFSVRTVVIDDCSRDTTYEEAKAAGATVLRHVINSGAGAATRTGLRYCERNAENLAYVITIDADGQHSSDDIERLIDFAITHKANMIVGNRLHAANKKDMPLHRTFGNWGLSLISRILFGIKTKDTQSGLRLFSASALPKIANYTIDRYGFCTEMLWLAVRHGVDIHEMPISVKYSAESLSKGQSNWGVVDLVLDLVWIRITR